MFSYTSFFLSNFRTRSFVRSFAVAVIVVVCSLYTHLLQFFAFLFCFLHFSICFFLVAFVLCIHIHKINGLKTFFAVLFRLLYLLSVLFISMCKPLYHIVNAFVHSKQYY